MWHCFFDLRPTFQATEYGSVAYYDGRRVWVCLTGLDTAWTGHYYLAAAAVFVVAPFMLLLAVYSLIAARLVLQRPPHAPQRHLAMQQWKAKKQVRGRMGTGCRRRE